MANRGRPKKIKLETIEDDFLSNASGLNLMNTINIDNMEGFNDDNETNNLSNNNEKIKKIKDDSDILAKNLLENIVNTYVTDDDTINKKYIQDKLKIDTILLSSLIFQLSVNNIAVNDIMNETRSGNTKSTFYMSLASLEKSKIEIIKQIDSFLYNIDITYKNILENMNNEKEKSKAETKSSDNNYRNTKDMLKDILHDDDKQL